MNGANADQAGCGTSDEIHSALMLYVVVPHPDIAFEEKVRAAGGIPITEVSPSLDGHPVARGANGAQTLAEVRRFVTAGQQPVAMGGLDRTTLAACAQAGAVGFVLDAALWALPEAPLLEVDKVAIARLTHADFLHGAAVLPSGLVAPRDALLAPFLARRGSSFAGVLQAIRADAGVRGVASPMLTPAPVVPHIAPSRAPDVLSPAARHASVPAGGERRDEVLHKVVALVSERTGYPADILDPELDMEADLGIDTVKQAEIFGLLRKTYGVPRDDAIRLKGVPTLGMVADYFSRRAEKALPLPLLASEPLIASADPPARMLASATPVAVPSTTSANFETRPLDDAVAIIGMGGVLPRAPNAHKFWENILNKIDCIVEVPAGRWDPAVHYDPDSTKEDKTYAKIGGFITDFKFEPLRFRVPPNTAKALDPVQQMALTAAAEALEDSGYDEKPFDRARCAVILGNSMGGEMRDETSKRIHLSEFASALRAAARSESELSLIGRVEAEQRKSLPVITEDTMPGELSSVIAGRIASALNLCGKSLTTDAACASSHAALDTAVKTILSGEADMALCGGADRSMSAGNYVKFCKIGALSSKGSTPFDARADGFVMGEGAVILVIKRLSHAVRDRDRIYAIVRGVGSSSDGRGKGITAPNPGGQKLAVKRAFEAANVLPRHIQLVEAHGTSTKVGDVVEVESVSEVFKGVSPGTVALGSVKSQIGHLKSAAGAVGLLKAAFALHHKVLPPSINFITPNPNIDWQSTPFYVNTEAKPWPKPTSGEPRRAAVSSFGFGGTNFHVIIEEYVPEYHDQPPAASALTGGNSVPTNTLPPPGASGLALVVNHRMAVPVIDGEIVVLGADSPESLAVETRAAAGAVEAAATLEQAARDIRTPHAHLHGHRLALAAIDRAALAAGLQAASELLTDPRSRQTLALKVRGASYGDGPRPAGKVAFLFPGQGSQYVNMCAELAKRYPVVRRTFEEADEVIAPLLGKKLSELIFVDGADGAALAHAEEALKQTEVTQPAMLAADIAMFRLLGEHNVKPDMVAGHSLGEYAALVAAGVLSFKDALLAVSARAKEVANVRIDDKGLMASFSCGPEQAEDILRGAKGYVVVTNKNCSAQTVIAGATPAVREAMEIAQQKGVETMLLPISAAFHTSIVAPASAPLRRVLERIEVHAPQLPVYTNVDATPYPNDPNTIRDILAKQIAAPVEWVKEMNAMWDAGARTFIEVGPKRALAGFVNATLGKREGILMLVTNHPKTGDLPTFYAALAKLASVGWDLEIGPSPLAGISQEDSPAFAVERKRLKEAAAALERYGLVPADVVVSGAAVGLPGQAHRVFDDNNFDHLFEGKNRIDRLDSKWAQKFIEKDIVRLVKDAGEPRLESVKDENDVLKLAGRRGELDIEKDYGIAAKLVMTLDITSKLAIAAAHEALHDAGIPLVRERIVATTGKILPGDWALPSQLQDDTGIIFASAFAGYDNFVKEVSAQLARRLAKRTLTELDALYHEILDAVPAEKKGRVSAFYAKHTNEMHKLAGDERRIESFNRHFLFSVLSMGHAELAEILAARGPNTQINAACSSTTQAIAIAEDWIRTGRARRVIVVGADDATSENLLEWIGSGFLVSGAATTASSVEGGALPFDKRRHGMIIGMGAVGLVIECREDVEARGMVPVARLVATKIANSAYHGSRLDVTHIAREAKELVEMAARRLDVPLESIGENTIFVSHETYTPARGGSASAEASAMRSAFGSSATMVLVTNTKGFTGHAMGAGIEDALAVKALQFGKVPPIANLRDIDPEFMDLNLSRGGTHARRYALRFSAGFGSQLAIAFFEKMADGTNRMRDASHYQSFLDRCSGVPGTKAERVARMFRVTTATAPAAAPAASVPIAVLTAPTALPTPASGSSGVDVLKAVVMLVSEKTGYPIDLLDPNLDMEADLGIDTVKQAEIFSQLREQFAVPREGGLALKDYPTLAKVAEYMSSRMGARLELGRAVQVTPPLASPIPGADEPGGVCPAPAPAPMASQHAALVVSNGPNTAHEIRERITAIIATRTGYPPEILDPNLDMEADLGIDTVKQAEIFSEVRESFGIPRIEGTSLKDHATISRVAEFVSTHSGRREPAQPHSSAVPPATANIPLSGGLVRRVPRLVEAPAAGSTVRVAYVVGRDDLSEALRHHHPTTTGQVAIFLGHPKELFLFAREHAAQLEAGTLGLLAVTHLGGEHAISVRANPSHPEEGGTTGMAKALAAEFPKAWIRALDLDPDENVAQRVQQVDAELLIDHSRVEVGRKGAHRYVVLTIAAGTTDDATPKLTPKSIVLVTGGAKGITAEILKALAPQKPVLILLGRTAAPTDADASFDDAVMRENAKAELAATGQRVTPVNIEKLVAPWRSRHEVYCTLDALRAMGATVEYYSLDAGDAVALDRLLADVRGRHGQITGVIHAAGIEESKRIADKDEAAFDRAWSPKAGAAITLARLTERDRPQFFVMFGSAAGRYGNAAQADYSAANDAMAKLARALRANGTQASVFCWGPWGEAGMATRGSTLSVLSAAGVEPISTREGVAAFLSELARLDESEVVLAKSLGQLEAANHDEGGPRTLRRVLDPKDPTLDHHRIDGVPYLAGVQGLQAFVDAAMVRVTGFENVHFGYPVKLLRNEPVEVVITVDDLWNAKLASVSKGPVPQQRTHFTGTLLTAQHAAPTPRPFAGTAWNFSPIYPPLFHGPAFQMLSHASRVSPEGIEIQGRSPGPGISAMAATLEGALQALGLWGLAVARKMALPERIGRCTLHGEYDAARTTYRVFNAHLTGGRVTGTVECVVGDKVVASLDRVSLLVTGPTPIVETPPV